MNHKPTTAQHLDHAVRTGLISAGLIGVAIGILYGLTHSVQAGAALTHAIDIYGDSTMVSFDTGSPGVAAVLSAIPAVIGGVAGAGAPIGALTLARWLKLGAVAQAVAGLVLAVVSGAAGGAIIMSLVPQFIPEGAALGAGVGTITGIVAISSFQLQSGLGNDP